MFHCHVSFRGEEPIYKNPLLDMIWFLRVWNGASNHRFPVPPIRLFDPNEIYIYIIPQFPILRNVLKRHVLKTVRAIKACGLLKNGSPSHSLCSKFYLASISRLATQFPWHLSGKISSIYEIFVFGHCTDCLLACFLACLCVWLFVCLPVWLVVHIIYIMPSTAVFE